MRVALIGDSHSAYHFNNIEDLLIANGHEVASSFERSGWSVKKYLATNSLEQLNEFQPDAAIIALGGNNHNLSDEYGERLRIFVDALRDQGITGPIVWLGPFEADKEVRQDVWDRHEWTSEYQKDFLPQLGVSWIDMRPSSLVGPWTDGVHFSRDEYARMIDEISPAIISGLNPFSVGKVVRHPAFWITSIVILVGSLWTGYYFLRK